MTLSHNPVTLGRFVTGNAWIYSQWLYCAVQLFGVDYNIATKRFRNVRLSSV